MAKKKPQQIKPQPRPRDAKGRFIKATPTPQPQQKPERIKDAKKVAAGKVRAATGIKENGKYITKIFSNEIARTLLAEKNINVSNVHADQTEKIEQLLKEAKLTKKEIKNFYEQRKDIFDDLKLFGSIKGTAKNSNNMEKILDTYKGKIFINNGEEVKEVSKGTAKYELVKFKNFLSSTLNVVEIAYLPVFSTSGEMTINIPDGKQLFENLKLYFGVTNKKSLDEIDGDDLMKAIEEILKDLYNDETNIIIYVS